MKLNHANLCATDVPVLTEILTRHFGFEVEQSGRVPDDAPVPSAGGAFAMLRGSDGFSLVITQIIPGSPEAYPTGFHLGFMLDAPDEVRAKHRELADAGRDPKALKEFEAMGAAWTAFYCPVGDGMEIEVNAHVPLTAMHPPAP